MGCSPASVQSCASGELGEYHRDPRQDPQVGVELIGPGALQQGLLDLGELGGDLGLGTALGERLGRLQPSGLAGGALPLGVGAAGSGHRRTLTQHQPSRQPNPRVK
jgi:hypothetical protein